MAKSLVFLVCMVAFGVAVAQGMWKMEKMSSVRVCYLQ